MTDTRVRVIEDWIPDSHDFIDFGFDARTLPSEIWALLGEASSKIELISGVPLRPDTAKALNGIFLAKGVHATTAIEGNTLSEDEVAERIDDNLDLSETEEYLGEEVDNIVDAYNWIVDRIREGVEPGLSLEDLRRFNHMVLDGLELEEGVVPGEFRDHVVAVGDYRSPPPDVTVPLLKEMCAWLNSDSWNQEVGGKSVLPILKAILAHLYIAWIHPFGDGNGRTARLVEYAILTRAGVPTPSAHVMADHYNRTRAQYYRALSAARKHPRNFVIYAVKGLIEGLRDQISRVRQQQLQVAWVNFVHEVFQSQPNTDASDRRLKIAIALARKAEPVEKSEVRELTPKIAAAYGDKTRKTVTRDLNKLTELDLVVRTPAGYSANTDIIRAFRPLVNPAVKL